MAGLALLAWQAGDRIRASPTALRVPAPSLPMPTTAPGALTGISSMATREVLAELCRAWQQAGGDAVNLLSIGGVDAARRVAAGEAFDVVVLAADAIDKLIASGQVRAGSRVDLVSSGVAVAVREGAPRPDLGSEASLRAAVLAAPTLGYSTGPSGVQLARLFERWGIAEQIQPRIVVPPPGVPVGQLVAEGRVALGFQQLSELINLPGITVVGGLPAEVAIVTTFSGGVCSASTRPDAAAALLQFMAAPDAAEAKRRQGMAPA
jgi:molybdate transport system substrate-binding protein